ncbi:MAG: hypothetical protein ACLQHK_01950 [Gallionellaceae bacterium]
MKLRVIASYFCAVPHDRAGNQAKELRRRYVHGVPVTFWLGLKILTTSGILAVAFLAVISPLSSGCFVSSFFHLRLNHRRRKM